MRVSAGIIRRDHRLLCLLTAAALLAGACSGDDDDAASGDDAIEVGPGSDEASPPERLAEQPPGQEPGWAETLAAPQSQLAEGESTDATTFDLATGAGLSAPPLRRPPRTTTTTRAGNVSALYGTYTGTVQIEIAYYDYCQTYDGRLAYAGSAEYEMPGDVYINARAEHDGVRERSPFNVIFSSELGLEGSIFVMSGQVVTDTRDGRSALIDYWDIDVDDDEITGELTDRWPGVAYNLVTTSQPLVPCQPGIEIALSDQIADGAELTGTVDDDAVDLELVGQSLDREVRFRATIVAERQVD